jgi:undecaprenyl pyrophosphate phosphatase UppP
VISSDLLAAAVQGLVEGITEFLPVSSTGHLILSGYLLGFDDDRAKVFDVVIQLGAILAVIWIYRQRFVQVLRTAKREPSSRRFITNLVLGFIPAAVLGLLLHRWIKAYLFSPVTVAWALLVGGVAILLVERWRPVERVPETSSRPRPLRSVWHRRWRYSPASPGPPPRSSAAMPWDSRARPRPNSPSFWPCQPSPPPPGTTC